MKLTGAFTEPFSAIRKRKLAYGGGQADRAQAPEGDRIAFLGLAEAELTPAVRGALKTLTAEIDDLRSEVSGLKAKLAEVEGLADRDTLTPLLNRRALVRELARVRTFAQRYGAPASLVYFDLDGFKAVNDRYGHAAGDACIRAVADRLTANVRESDIVGRMGGDEFAVILVQSDLPTSEAKAKTLAAAIETTPISFGEWAAPLHVSYGVCAIAADADAETLVARADAAMFARKRAAKVVTPR